jgi:hypothetical protein
MNIRTALFVTTSLLGALALAACDSGSDGAGGSGGTGGTPGTGGMGTGGTGGTVSATDGWVRLAHLSPDSMGVDFCVTGADGMARPSGYAATGITYPGAGEYVTLPADTYTINIVAAGQACDSAPIGTVADYAVAAGEYHVVIVDGLQAGNTLAVGAVPEDNAPTTAGMVFLNMFHENSGAPAVQIGMVDPATDAFTSLTADMALAYQEYTSVEVPPVAMGTIIGVSQDGTTVDGRWTVPADLATGGASLFIIGTDATDIGAFACINLANTCVQLPAAM